MKSLKIIALCIAALTASPGLAGDGAVIARMAKYVGWGEDQLIFNKKIEISNGRNIYQMDCLQNRDGYKGSPLTFFTMTLPRRQFGFGYGPARFLKMEVNGISHMQIQPREKDFALWQDGDRRGGQSRFFFDGAVIELAAYMKPGSPVLWLKFSQPEKQIVPLKTAVIRLECVISGLVFNKQHVVVWDGAYGHKARTAARTLNQTASKSWIPLNAEDRYVILYDEILDGTARDNSKGYGPSFITWDYNSGVEKIQLDLSDHGINYLECHLKPDFREFTVGVWEWKDRYPNAEFMKMFRRERKNFVYTE